MRFLLVLLCACRFSWSAHMGAPPRASNDIKMVLDAPDEQSRTMARSVIGRDPHVTLIDLDPEVSSQRRAAYSVEPACAWSVQQGAEYFATASVHAGYSSDFECTKYKLTFSKSGDECIDGVVTNKATVAQYTLDVYDANTCKQVNALSQKFSTFAGGDEEQSKPEALAKLAAKVSAKAEMLPEQVTIASDGRISGAAPDGYYAVYRGDRYSGYVNVRGAATPAEKVQPMYFPLAPSPGDALVARGRRKFVDLALDGIVGTLTFGGERYFAGGAGAHVRHYALDGGLQYGFGVDLLGAGIRSATVALFTPELGWGFPIAPGFVASANLGIGLGRSSQVLSAADIVVTAYEPHAVVSARMQTFLTTWFYVTADVGFVYTGTFGNWDGINMGEGSAMSMRSPIARIYAGFDL